ncbi:S26 family signal peptidase [Streptomyces inhibens]|uniref:S26 family signal peptidase n=1 Tax=Streptomyces inhibens TaxID=2293571 RepID=A0A371PV97_STRIH|nr:S26 family signal peptidase [Streptomyces inhibens]REK86406.1 S26 family signal peptidase [Streptomyces inhibens]
MRTASWALAGGVPALAVGLVLTVFALGRHLVAVTVRGASMEPAYREGDRVLVRRGRLPAPGQVVVVTDLPDTGPTTAPVPAAAARAVPSPALLIKRVAAVPGDRVPRDRVPALAGVPERYVPPGKLVLLGDNPEASFDSRHRGYFATACVVGTVWRSLPG